MAIKPAPLRLQIEQAMRALDMDAATLSRAIGKSKDYLRDYLEGRKRTLSADAVQAIELKVAEQRTLAAQGQGFPSVEPYVGINPNTGAMVATLGQPNYRPPPEFLGARDLPVFAAAEGGPGEMVVSTDPIELVPRPWYMREVKDGYAVLIVGESMAPAFEPGDMAIVNPRLPPMRNKNAIFVQDRHGGSFTASIKRLVKWDERLWHVRQFNEPKDFTMSKAEWPQALRVVGKYEG